MKKRKIGKKESSQNARRHEPKTLRATCPCAPPQTSPCSFSFVWSAPRASTEGKTSIQMGEDGGLHVEQLSRFETFLSGLRAVCIDVKQGVGVHIAAWLCYLICWMKP